MVNPDDVRNVVGIIGNFISFGLFLSPLPTFLTIIRKRDVEEFVPDPYLATFLNCALWVFYGLPVVHPNSILVATINGTGLAIEAAYLSIFFAFAPRLGLFLSPLPTFLTIIRKRDVEEFVPDPYLATFLNCALWVFYGLPVVHPNSILVATINGTGLAIEAAYLSIFFAFAPRPKRAKMLGVLAVEVAFIAAVVAGVVLGAHTHEKRSLVVGCLCVFFGTLMYASPLTVMKKVIVTQSVEYMPFTLSFVSFLNGICWTTYALIRFDIFVTIPNGMGTLLGLVQLIIYFCYYGSTPKSSGTTAGMELLVKAGDGDNN